MNELPIEIKSARKPHSHYSYFRQAKHAINKKICHRIPENLIPTTAFCLCFRRYTKQFNYKVSIKGRDPQGKYCNNNDHLPV